MAGLSPSAIDNLDKQGFCDLGDEAKSRYSRPLRFTPAVATIVVVVGLILQSPLVLGSMALVALSGVLFPRGMLIDLAYNLGIRHLLGSPPLPPTPTPRRFSHGVSTSWLYHLLQTFVERFKGSSEIARKNLREDGSR